MNDSDVDRRIGVTVLTGFLGSGKTTLLNRLLALPRYRRSLVVVNEFGEVGVDHALVREVSDQVVLLAGGCMCCTVRGGLVQTLRDMFMLAVQRKIEPFDHVWIETTGLADAAPVLFTLRHDFFVAQRYLFEASIAVADTSHIVEQLRRHDTARQQIALSDMVVFTKTDLVDESARVQAHEAVASVNPVALSLDLDIDGPLPGVLSQPGPYRGASQAGAAGNAAGLGGLADAGEASGLSAFATSPGWLSGLSVSQPRRHENVATFVVTASDPWRRGAFLAVMDECLQWMGDRLLRMKGIVRFEGGSAPYVVHAVHQVLYPFVPLAVDADVAAGSALVFIVERADYDTLQAGVRARLARLTA